MRINHVNEDGTPKYTNRLIEETSPYLAQHAHNPVNWYPWGDQALTRARDERKPIHLSIGYSACHFCHLLAYESFEDEATARLLNENFINIKVDREERPDLDRIYQFAHQMLTQRAGGWPLTMFLTHDDHRPFFGGTYFPKEPRYGMPAFSDLITRVAEYYKAHEPELRQQNEALMQVFGELNPPPADESMTLTREPIAKAREHLAETFDAQFGGFGGAPKFPHPNTIERLLRDWHATSGEPEPDLHALYMATLTLRRMGEGGIFDQIGGGFSRYSVDQFWMIPHFEKMLYDNGQLLAVYAQAAVATGDEFYRRIAAQTAEWTIRDMQSPEGGYYSSLDADSEGHEGKFYVWTRDEIRGALTDEEYAAFAPRFGLDRDPNFEGKWHLHAYAGIEKVDVQRRIDSGRAKLLAIRNRRVWPGRDEKILTSWNAIMIRGMAIAARALDRADLAQSATRSLDFIRSTLWSKGRLLATYKDGRAHLAAYLDDYVLLADAILELQQVRFRSDELAFARELLDVALAHFEDRENGGFFFTADDHEALIHRGKTFSDDATPSGNGIAALVLLRMGYLLGETGYLAAAERTLRAAWRALEKYPHAHTSLLNALDELTQPPETIVLRGDTEKWRQELAKLYAPRRLVLAIAEDAKDLPEALSEKAARGDAVAYVCRGSTCSAPIDSMAALARDLRLGLAP
ncbi:MAG: thioredoxin domain-containing protein [Steroidobacteraceae bacterium]